MVLLNRVLVIFIAGFFILLWAGIVILVLRFPSDVAASLEDVARYIQENTLYVQGLVTAFGGATILVSLLLLLAEVASRGASIVRLPQGVGGETFVTTQAVMQRLRDALEQIPDVTRAEPSVTSRKNAVAISLDVYIGLGSSIPLKSEEVCRVVRELVEGQMGVGLAGLVVNVRRVAPAVSSRATARPDSGADSSSEPSGTESGRGTADRTPPVP